MRYELTDHEWTAIKPMLPNKPRGVARVNDRRVLNGIFWVLRSGAPWRDLPKSSIHHLLQSLRSLAPGGRLEQDHARAGWRPRRCGADDRHLDRPRASARCLRHPKQKAVYGPITRRVEQQDSCRGRWEWPAGLARSDGW